MRSSFWTTGIIFSIALSLCLVCGIAEASDPSAFATFESIYQKSWEPNWLLIAAGSVLFLGLLIIFPPGAPAGAAAIGSTIGGWFGLHGIAATKFGLALLGGGAIASGGLGIAGGVAVLGSALFFTTETVLDYSVSRISESYQYESFALASREMTTLPMPRSGQGRKRYRDAVSELENIHQDEPFSSSHNRDILENALAKMDTGRPVTSSPGQVRLDALRALIHFAKDDYRAARVYAERAHRWGMNENLSATLPAFILAVSSLYEDEPELVSLFRHFEYAILAEPDHGLTPLLFSIFLDRLLYRMNDGAVSARELRRVAEIALERQPGEQTSVVLTVIVSRYLLRLFAEQQKIQSLATTCDADIRDSEHTLQVVKAALEEYRLLVQDGQFVTGALRALSAVATRDEALLREVPRFVESMQKYSADQSRLEAMIIDLETHQAQHRALNASGLAANGEQGFPLLPDWVVAVTTYNQWGEEIEHGSGFFIDDKGTFVTLTRNISGAYRIVMETSAGRQYEVTHINRLREETGIALLGVEGLYSAYPSIDLSWPVDIGDSVHVLWAPADSSRACSRGRVSEVIRVDRVDYLQVSTPFFPGFAGGPVMSDEGKVIGIAGAEPEGRLHDNLALPIAYLQQELQHPPDLMPFKGRLVSPVALDLLPPPGWFPRRPKVDPTQGRVSQRQALAKLAEFERQKKSLRLSHNQFSGDLGEGMSALLTVTDLGEESYTIVAACDDNCGRIALFLHHADGSLVQEATDDLELPSISWEPEHAGEYLLRARLLECDSVSCGFALVVFSGEAGD